MTSKLDSAQTSRFLSSYENALLLCAHFLELMATASKLVYQVPNPPPLTNLRTNIHGAFVPKVGEFGKWSPQSPFQRAATLLLTVHRANSHGTPEIPYSEGGSCGEEGRTQAGLFTKDQRSPSTHRNSQEALRSPRTQASASPGLTCFMGLA